MEFVARVLAGARPEAAAWAGTEEGAARDPAAEERLAGRLQAAARTTTASASPWPPVRDGTRAGALLSRLATEQTE